MPLICLACPASGPFLDSRRAGTQWKPEGEVLRQVRGNSGTSASLPGLEENEGHAPLGVRSSKGVLGRATPPTRQFADLHS